MQCGLMWKRGARSLSFCPNRPGEGRPQTGKTNKHGHRVGEFDLDGLPMAFGRNFFSIEEQHRGRL